MSWLFKSLNLSDNNHDHQDDQDDAIQSLDGGVKDDLSAIGESIGRQLRGVAAFLAPPPSPPPHHGGDASPSSRTFDGIRSDLAEIGGTFKHSLSLLSGTGISKFASNLLQLDEENEVDNGRDGDGDGDGGGDDEEEEEEEEGVGITDEVVEFAGQISSRPELWTDFPLSLDREFDMSDAQYEHASVIEQLVPSLARLRSRLSSDMSEKQFWMIYFILLLPRLNDDDWELLSTPEIVEARETLLLMLRTKKSTDIESENPQSGGSSELENKVNDSNTEKTQHLEKAMICENSNASENSEGSQFESTKKLIQEENAYRFTSSSDHNKETSVADNSNAGKANEEHENVNNLLQDQECATTGLSSNAPKQFPSEDDVSFSDLEDEDDNDLPVGRSNSGAVQSTRASSPEGSSDWVQLNRNVGPKGVQSGSRDKLSEGEESNDWLTVDDFDP